MIPVKHGEAVKRGLLAYLAADAMLSTLAGGANVYHADSDIDFQFDAGTALVTIARDHASRGDQHTPELYELYSVMIEAREVSRVEPCASRVIELLDGPCFPVVGARVAVSALESDLGDSYDKTDRVHVRELVFGLTSFPA